MGWDISILQGVAATAANIGSEVYDCLSTTPVEALLVDKAVLEKLSLMSGTEISPIVNSLGETIGYTAKAAATSNGATSLSSTFISITKNGVQVTQEMIDAATPLIEGGTTADLAVGDVITQVGLDATAGVGGAAGTGVGGTALASVAGPAVAVALGVASGVALYNIAPEFWTSVSQRLEAAGKMIGDKVISFFKTDGTEYYDSTTISIIKDALIDAGYLSNAPIAERTCEELNVSPVVQPVSISDRYIYDGTWSAYKYYRYITNATVAAFKSDNRVIGTDYGTPIAIIVTADAPNQTAHMVTGGGNTWQNPTISEVRLNSTYTYNGKTVYYATFSDSLQAQVDNFIAALNVPSPPTNVLINAEERAKLAWIMEFGDGSSVTPSPNELPQEPNGDDPVSPVPTDVTDPLHDPTTDPNHNKKKHYDPTPDRKKDKEKDPEDDPEPHIDPNPQPNPDPNPDPNPTPDPDYPEDPTDPNPSSPDNEDEGHDPEPPPVIPMAANAISRVYNPTQSEVDALGNYLWNSVNIQDILGIFNSPIDGIIGFMKLYATPDTGDSREIKLGYLSTGVSAKVVTHQVVTVNCGVIQIPLSKKNATDYPPYTTVQIYLPFIGIEPLNGYDLVGSQLACIYRIDCYTGACIAQLKVTRDNMTAKLYEFSGNCAQHLPLTAGNFHQIAGNIISGAIGGGLTGGIAGASIGAAQALTHSNIEVQRSGNLTANAGMLGTRTPYIIITRAVSADAANYSYFYGYPANKTVYLRNCRGYVRVKNIILHTSATEAEKAEIEELLKKGVYI